MIYNDAENSIYRVKYYIDPRTGHSPVYKCIVKLGVKERAKIEKYIEFLREHRGVLDEPYTRHIKGKIRELRVDFASQRYRIFYFTFVGQTIILLHVFLKKTQKTPPKEIKRAEERYMQVINNKKMYED